MLELGVDLFELLGAVLDQTRDPASRTHLLGRGRVRDGHDDRVLGLVEVRAGGLAAEAARDRLCPRRRQLGGLRRASETERDDDAGEQGAATTNNRGGVLEVKQPVKLLQGSGQAVTGPGRAAPGRNERGGNGAPATRADRGEHNRRVHAPKLRAPGAAVLTRADERAHPGSALEPRGRRRRPVRAQKDRSVMPRCARYRARGQAGRTRRRRRRPGPGSARPTTPTQR